MTDAAFKAEFSDFKLVKTRSTAQIVLELPIEQADAALQALGGVPKPGMTVWVAVAVMSKKATSEKPKRSWDETPLSEQAGMRCRELNFQNWISKKHVDWVEMPISPDMRTSLTSDRVKAILGVVSKKFLQRDSISGKRWLALEEEYRQSQGLIAEQH